MYLQIMLRLPETHPYAIPCGETQRHVLGMIVHRPNHRTNHGYDKYQDTWRTGKRKSDDREPAFGVGLVHACMCKHRFSETMDTFRGVSYEVSDQHTDISAARQARYVSDTVLFNIANGMAAQERVNVEKGGEIGVKIVK